MAEESGALFIETNRFIDFCKAMRSELIDVFVNINLINREIDEFGRTWEGNVHDTFFLLFEDTKKDAANAEAQWNATMEKFEQAVKVYCQLEQKLDSLGMSQG